MKKIQAKYEKAKELIKTEYLRMIETYNESYEEFEINGRKRLS